MVVTKFSQPSVYLVGRPDAAPVRKGAVRREATIIEVSFGAGSARSVTPRRGRARRKVVGNCHALLVALRRGADGNGARAVVPEGARVAIFLPRGEGEKVG